MYLSDGDCAAKMFSPVSSDADNNRCITAPTLSVRNTAAQKKKARPCCRDELISRYHPDLPKKLRIVRFRNLILYHIQCTLVAEAFEIIPNPYFGISYDR